jgi:hypothetical protein
MAACSGRTRRLLSGYNPQHDEFQPVTMWSLSNAFTSAFKELEPIPVVSSLTKGIERFLVQVPSPGLKAAA